MRLRLNKWLLPVGALCALWGVLCSSPSGPGADSDDMAATAAVPSPTIVDAQVLDGLIGRVSWEAIDSSRSYTVYRRLLPAGEFQFVGGTDSLSFADSGLSAGNAYAYALRAWILDRFSDLSEPETLTTVPGTPLGYSNVFFDSVAVTLAWYPSPGAESYNVCRALDGERMEPAGTIDQPFFSDSGLNSGTQYRYGVTAVNGTGESDDTLFVDLTTGVNAPVSVRAAINGSGEIVVHWRPVASALNYIVLRTDAGTGSVFVCDTVGDTLYTDAMFTSATAYVYGVRAWGENGFSLLSLSDTVRTDSTWSCLGRAGFSSGEVRYLSLAARGDGLVVGFQDAGVLWRASVFTFDEGNWQPLGAPGFSDGRVDYVSLAVSGEQVACAFQDWTVFGRLSVYLFNGGRWQVAGAKGVSDTTASHVAICYHDGLLYAAYSDVGDSGRVKMNVWDGSAWSEQSMDGTADSAVTAVNLVSDGTDLYLGYSDERNNGRAVLMRQTGTEWTQVGESISDGPARYVTVAVDEAELYCGFRDGANGEKAVVKRWSGTTWNTVAATAASQGAVDFVTVAATGGSLYTAYFDVAVYQALVVRKEGGGWVRVGDGPFADSPVASLSMAFLGGVPCLAFNDASHGYRASVVQFK